MILQDPLFLESARVPNTPASAPSLFQRDPPLASIPFKQYTLPEYNLDDPSQLVWGPLPDANGFLAVADPEILLTEPKNWEAGRDLYKQNQDHTKTGFLGYGSIKTAIYVRVSFCFILHYISQHVGTV